MQAERAVQSEALATGQQVPAEREPPVPERAAQTETEPPEADPRYEVQQRKQRIHSPGRRVRYRGESAGNGSGAAGDVPDGVRRAPPPGGQNGQVRHEKNEQVPQQALPHEEPPREPHRRTPPRCARGSGVLPRGSHRVQACG